MSDIRNWRPISETTGVYIPDKRWQIRVLEAAITPIGVGQQWSVHLLFDGRLCETLMIGLETKEDADEEMVSWVRSHPTIISDRE